MDEAKRIEIGKRLKEARLSRGLRADYVYKTIGVSRSALGHYEAGRRIPKDNIKIKLSGLYGISIKRLFF